MIGAIQETTLEHDYGRGQRTKVSDGVRCVRTRPNVFVLREAAGGGAGSLWRRRLDSVRMRKQDSLSDDSAFREVSQRFGDVFEGVAARFNRLEALGCE